MSEPSTQKKKFNANLLGRIIRLASPYKKLFTGTIVLTLILAPLSVLRPKLMQNMVDDYIAVNDLAGLGRLALILVGLLVLETGLQYIFHYSTSFLGQLVIKDLRVRVFNHITDLRPSYFDRTPIGTSTTRTINDVETINKVFSEGMITIIADILSIVVILFVMFATSWKLTLVCLTTFPFLILASYIFKEKVKTSFQQVRTQIARMNAFLQERISGMRVVQIFHAEEQEAQKFKTINREYTQANLNSVLYYAVFYPVVEIISAASLGLMVWYGAKGVITQDVTIGALIVFPIYINMLFRPVRVLADKFNTLQMGMVAAERVFQVLDTQDRIPNDGDLAVEKLAGKVEFEQVWFAYQGEEYVLKGVDFTIEPGQTLAIVGSTGSGKTTIVNLLNRFYEYQKGNIRIDDRPIEAYDLYAYRRRVSMVLQDVFLFSGSVMENITLHDPSITPEMVYEAAKKIGAHEFIEKLPGGYFYEVMERGATLSLGQRQLISFVRALVFDPDILILDEATSSVDPETESVIQYAIEKLIAKRTSVIIAHRLSTIRQANAILVLHKGQVAEYGSHETLLQKEDGRYRQLYEMQFIEEVSGTE